MRTVAVYLLREIITPFFLGLGVFTTILLIARILKLIEMVVNRGVALMEVLRLFSFILPTFLEVTVPMAVLLAVAVGFGRLASDGELVALKASGLSLPQLSIPVGLFAIAVWIFASLISLYARPWGNTHLRSTLFDLAKSRATAGIRERIFNDDFDGLVIYVDKIEPPGDTLRGILIADRRDQKQRSTIFAKAGSVVPNEQTHSIVLRLLDGTVHSFFQYDHSYHRTDFATYDIALDLAAALGKLEPRERDPSELTIEELNDAISRKEQSGASSSRERIELHRKFAVPFASLIFAMIGIPLGSRPTRAVRSRSFAISVALVFVYYLLLTLGESLAQRDLLRPSVALWIPNIVFAPISIVLFLRSANDAVVRSHYTQTVLASIVRLVRVPKAP